MRRGISLLEVLISMFVLAVGLLGVAALIPAGSAQLNAAAKLDNAAMIGRAAFRDMQVRGFLDPVPWRDTATGAGTFGFDAAQVGQEFTYDGGGTRTQNLAVIMDPLGVAAGLAKEFPAGYSDPDVQPLRRIVPFQPTASATAVYDSIFRSQFDQITEANSQGADYPAVPRWFGGASPSKRMSEGNYSWLATICSDSLTPAVSRQLEISVAVFYKRDMSGAREFWCKSVDYPGGGTLFNQELIVRDLPTDPLTNKRIKLKPGQWIMLAGMRRLTGTGEPRHVYKWLRVIAAGEPNGPEQQVTLAGGDWPMSAPRTRVFIPEGVVSVVEKRLPLEIQ